MSGAAARRAATGGPRRRANEASRERFMTQNARAGRSVRLIAPVLEVPVSARPSSCPETSTLTGARYVACRLPGDPAGVVSGFVS